MITPNIAPRNVISPLSRGLFTAAKNSVSRTKELTKNISDTSGVEKKNQKFAMNFIQFFGSKKTAKILKKSLESIKKSIVSTLEIAKLLRTSLGDLAKSTKKSGRGGFFSGLGGLVGGGLMALFGKAALITLGVLAVGGLGALLIANKEAVFKFLETNRRRFMRIIKPLIDNAFRDIFRSPEVKEIESDAFNRVSTRMGELDADGKTRDQLFEEARESVLSDIKRKMEGIDIRTNPELLAEKNRLKLLKQALEGKEEFQGLLTDRNSFLGLSTQLGKTMTSEAGFETSPAEYMNKTSQEKLRLIRQEIRANNNNLEQLRFRVMSVLDRNPNEDERGFAIDLLSAIRGMRNNDTEFLEGLNQGVLPSNEFKGKGKGEGGIDNLVPSKEKIKEMFQAKPISQVNNQVKNDELDSDNKPKAFNFNGDNIPIAASNGFSQNDLIPITRNAENGSGYTGFISTSPGDRMTLSAMVYGISLGEIG